MMAHWTSKNIPDLTNKIAIVTGANRGIGYEIARSMANHGAIVILACRSQEQGQAAARRICQECPEAEAVYSQLDLADLASVRRFANTFMNRYDRLDLLINNAGIMATPYGKTVDGFESQFGTNHLGHFALTGLVFDRIVHTPCARVVTMSSGGHRFGQIDFDNLNGEKSYNPQRAYAQSKLANLMFTYELQRRFEELGVDSLAAAAHPGWTATDLAAHWRMVQLLSLLIGQKPEMGALPALYAAIGPDVQGGDYYGPGGWQEVRGYPRKVRSSDKSHERAVALKLWNVSEVLTGVRYPQKITR